MSNRLNTELRAFLGRDVLITLEADQLNILGQTFRPVFVGEVTEVTDAYITLHPVIIKLINAPFFHFPTPLSFPLEKVIGLTPFDRNTIFPLQ